MDTEIAYSALKLEVEDTRNVLDNFLCKRQCVKVATRLIEEISTDLEKQRVMLSADQRVIEQCDKEIAKKKVLLLQIRAELLAYAEAEIEQALAQQHADEITALRSDLEKVCNETQSSIL